MTTTTMTDEGLSSSMAAASDVNPKDVSSLSTTQEQVLSIVILIPTVLSIIGSSIIVHLILLEKKNTPYRRILFMMSICDIIATINYGLSPYLMPTTTLNPWVWAVGNEATCTMLGTFTQFGFSTQLYSGMLSLYFVLTIRRGMTQSEFARCIEPTWHIAILSFSIITATVGAVMGFYDAVSLGPGCWVNNWPDNCGSDPEDTGGECYSVFIAWIYGGLPSISMLVLIAINNLLLYCHVRSTVLRGATHSFSSQIVNRQSYQQQQLQLEQEQEQEQQDPSSPPTPEGSSRLLSLRSSISGSIGMSSRRHRSSSILTQNQLQRVRAVGTQSFLYVAAYFVTYIWSYAIRIAESMDVSASDSDKIFPLLVIQSIFLPSQGFWNFWIFIRPSYMRSRTSYPLESRVWCIRRALYGNRVQPYKTTNATTRRELLEPTQSITSKHENELFQQSHNTLSLQEHNNNNKVVDESHNTTEEGTAG